MSEMAEKLEQVRAALEASARMFRKDARTETGWLILTVDIERAAPLVESALAALPTAEEMAQMQREAAAWRKLREVIGGKVQLVDAAASSKALAAAKVIEELGGNNADE